jgi:hypothetical protein
MKKYYNQTAPVTETQNGKIVKITFQKYKLN